MRKGTKKNNVTLREKLLFGGNISLYLDIYRNGVRNYEFLKLYIKEKPHTPKDRETNKETLELAESIRTQRESELNHTAHGQIAPTKQRVSFFAYASNYHTRYTKKDVRMISGAIERFRAYLIESNPKIKPDKLLFSHIDKNMIIGFVEYLEKHSRGEGAYGYYQRFKKILKNAIDNGVIARNPAEGVKCSTVEGLRKDILSNDEITALAKTPCKNAILKRAFIFSCCTGLRFCDIKELRYRNIDFSSGKLSIEQQKTGKLVIIDLNTTAKKILATAGEPTEQVFVLPSFEGCTKTLKAWVKRAGINKKITWHCARHSFAVNLLTSDQRPDIKTVSSTLGHSSLRHTEKYTRVIDELKKAAVEALPNYEIE